MLDHPIDVHSAPGKGSVFSIQAPLARGMRVAPRSEPVRDEIAAPLPRTILVIEDEYFVRTGLEALFGSEGVECVCVATGHEALTLVTEQRMRPDLLVSDYNLPGMNGVEAIQALRGAMAWKVPAIVLTGDIRSQSIEAIAQHDVGVLVKPTDADGRTPAAHQATSCGATVEPLVKIRPPCRSLRTEPSDHPRGTPPASTAPGCLARKIEGGATARPRPPTGQSAGYDLARATPQSSCRCPDVFR